MISDTIISTKGYKVLVQMKPGAGATVFLAEHINSKKKCVLKYTFIEEKDKARFERQMKFWKELNLKSEFIVKLKDYYYFDKKNSCIIMEYCEGGDLETLIKKRKDEGNRFSENEIMGMLTNIAEGLNVMHKMKIMHRDVKTANILICRNGKYILADFNMSKETEGMASTMAGSIIYSAPEKFESESYSFAADLYSLGIAVYEMMTLTPAFTSLSKIVAHQYAPVSPTLGYSDSLVDLTHRLIAKNPSDRPNAQEVLDMPFVLRYVVCVRYWAEVTAAMAEERRRHAEEMEKLREEVKRQAEEMERLKKNVAALENNIGSEKLAKTFDADVSGLVTLSNNCCTFNTSDEEDTWHTVFVSCPMAAGICRITFKIVKLQIYSNEEAMFGVCPQSMKNTQRDTYLGDDSVPGSGGLYIWSGNIHLYYYPDEYTPNLFSSFPYKIGSAISVEFNANLHTIHFFVDGKTFTHYLSNAPNEPMVFAVSGFNSSSFEINSLSRIARSSVPSDTALTAVSLG